MVKNGFCLRDFGQTNEHQRHFNEWPISELHGEVDSINVMECRLCLSAPVGWKDYFVDFKSTHPSKKTPVGLLLCFQTILSNRYSEQYLNFFVFSSQQQYPPPPHPPRHTI
jgi:hypothetical protein